jgi:hypothetical protein
MDQKPNQRVGSRLLGWPSFFTLAGVTLGLVAALGAVPTLNRDPLPGPVALWVADREGQSVVALDRDLYVVEVRRSTWPVGVLAGERGTLWTVEALEASPLGDHRLALWAPGGDLLWEAEVGPVLDLASDGTGRPLIVEMGTGPSGSNRLLMADPNRASSGGGSANDLVELLERPQLSCAAGDAGIVLVGTGDGRLLALRLTSPAQVLRVLEIGGQVGDIAPLGPPGREPSKGRGQSGAGGAGWWVLDVATPGRLLRLGPDLRVLWETPTQIRPMHLIPDPMRESVWAADVNEPFVRRWGVDGSLELNLGDLPLGGLDRGVALGGGIVLAAPGALLRLDGTGSVLPGQGGFHFPVDLAPFGG